MQIADAMINAIQDWMLRRQCLDEIMSAVEIRQFTLLRCSLSSSTNDAIIKLGKNDRVMIDNSGRRRLEALRHEKISYRLDFSIVKAKRALDKVGFQYVLVPAPQTLPFDSYRIGCVTNPTYDAERAGVLSELVKLELEGKVATLGNGKYRPFNCPACYGEGQIQGENCDICDAHGELNFKQYQAICEPIFQTVRLVKETSREQVEKRGAQIIALQKTMPELLYPSELDDVVLEVITK